jgi:hypothetical protein
MARPYPSPYAYTVVSYVAANPGCSKWDVAAHVTRDSRRCPSKQYYIVNTAIRYGKVVAAKVGGKYSLKVAE